MKIDWYKIPFLRERRNRQYTMVAIVVAWSVVLVWYGFIASVSGAKEARDLIGQSKELESELNAKIAAINEAKKLQDENKDVMDLVNTALPNEPKIVTFTNTLALLATNSNLITKTLSYNGEGAFSAQAGSDESKATKLLFTLTADGSYEDIESFIYKLEQLPRVVKIESINLSKVKKGMTTRQGEENAPDTTVTHPLKVTIAGEVYYRNE